MLRILTTALLLMWYIVPARGDMTLFLREVGNDVEMHLRGSIDTSGFSSISPLATTGGVYHYRTAQFTNINGARGTGITATVGSGLINGDAFEFANDIALTQIGTFPPLLRSILVLTTSPPFWFGFEDATQLFGQQGSIHDRILLPDGYVANEFLNLYTVAPNMNFANFGISVGDRWGVSFNAGAISNQKMLFAAVPEPGCLSLIAIALPMTFARFRR